MSSRLPGKNLALLGNHPLLAYPVSLALFSGVFAAVCVSTEDDAVAEVARRYGAEVPFSRPDNLSRDPATVVDVLLHALREYDKVGMRFEHVAVLLATAPFTCIEDIRGAMARYRADGPGALLSVTATEVPPFNALMLAEDGRTLFSAFPDSDFRATKSTECPPTYRSNGAIAIADRRWLEANRSFYGEGVVAWEMPARRSVDIDTEMDLEFARFLTTSCRVCPAEGVEVKPA